jgi:hypothetical protein
MQFLQYIILAEYKSKENKILQLYIDFKAN